MVAAMTCKLFLIKEVFGLKYAIILEAFNFHSDVSGMNLMAPELNNKWADEYSEKNSLTGLGSMDNKNQSKDVSVKKEVNDLKLIDSWLKAIDDRKNNNIALRQTGSEKIILFFQKKKQELIPCR